MKTEIITVSFDKDLKWLKYSMESRRRYCRSYHNELGTVLLDDSLVEGEQCNMTADWCKSQGINYGINKGAKAIKRGYVRQQYMKFYCDRYVMPDTEFICHVDSDSIFTEGHDPSIYFEDGKPIMLYTPYDVFFQPSQPENIQVALKQWHDITSEAMGSDVPHEFMRRMPLVYPKDMFVEVRKFVSSTHKKQVVHWMREMPNFSEYNFFGAWAWEYAHDQFAWKNTEEDDFDQLPLNQYWSHADFSVKEKNIHAFLYETPEYRHLNDISFTPA